MPNRLKNGSVILPLINVIIKYLVNTSIHDRREPRRAPGCQAKFLKNNSIYTAKYF